MFGYVFSKKKRVQIQNAQSIFEEVNTFARCEAFYTELAVTDTMTGLFELISLMAGLIMLRLNKMATPDSQKFAQIFFDVMFRGFDHSLREGGIGDLAVPKHMKRMMQGFQGRSYAYEAIFVSGVDAQGKALSHAEKLNSLNCNLYSGALEDNDPVLGQCFERISVLSDFVMGLDSAALLDGQMVLPNYESLNIQMTKKKSVA
jgi:cytochrome b pre-mRNA-processing protein 3